MADSFTAYPMVLTPILKPKVWGGRRLEALGKNLTPGVNIGESWELADLPDSIEGGRSVIANGPLAGMTLREALDRYERLMLGRARRSAEGGFPLLLKYLDARENLSIQVHPDEQYVRKHPGAHLKSEAWIIIDARPPGLIYKGVKPDVTKAEFEKHLRAGGGAVVDDLIAAPVQSGECHYLPSGTCHALGAGVMVAEVQTPSDTTFRVYDWDRRQTAGRGLHIKQALECIHFGRAAEPASRPGPSVTAEGIVTRRLLQTEYFVIERSTAERRASIAVVTNEMPMIWMVLEGAVTLRTQGAGTVEAARGTTVLMPAGLESSRATCQPGADLLVITLPPMTKGMIA
jgi:mannose-6-phosphate isomerase